LRKPSIRNNSKKKIEERAKNLKAGPRRASTQKKKLTNFLPGESIDDLPDQSGNLPVEHIVIVGGGVIGCCTAYYLTRHRKANRISITMLESTSIACGASGSKF
jgi:NADPH-dependent 2,4-dienoyl-CoA reductase/sulfur reductase-like enzyme